METRWDVYDLLCTLLEIVEYVVWYLVVLGLYHQVVFRNLPGHSYLQSRTILLVLLLWSVAHFLLLRTVVSNCLWLRGTTLLLPFGLYTAKAYSGELPRLTLAVMGGGLAVGVLLSLPILCRRWKRFRRPGRVLFRRGVRCLYLISSTLAVGGLVLMGNIARNTLWADSRIAVTAAECSMNREESAGRLEYSLHLLREESWETLTGTERLALLQKVADHEAVCLGLGHSLQVVAKPLDEGTTACYNDRDRTVTIDLTHLEEDGAGEVLESCLHECYHSWEHRLVDVYEKAEPELVALGIFDRAEGYRKEFRHYVSGEDNFPVYSTQWVETDARKYAESRVEEYLLWMEEVEG